MPHPFRAPYHRLTIVYLGSWLTLTSAALAGPEESAPARTATLSESLTGEAQSAYAAGRLLYEERDFAGAEAKFRRAYALSREPRLLWNMATCAKEQHGYARALQLIDEYLAGYASHLSAERRLEVHTTREALSVFVSPLRLDVEPAHFTLHIDEVEVVVPKSKELLLDLGTHSVRLSAPGRVPYVTRLDVPGKTPVTLRATLRPTLGRSTLHIQTDGAWTTIRIDGKTAGHGAWKGNIDEGKHLVEVSAADYVTRREEVTLTPGSTRTMHVHLEEERGTPWPWIVGGAALLVGGGLGGYFLWADPGDKPSRPAGSLGSFDVP